MAALCIATTCMAALAQSRAAPAQAFDGERFARRVLGALSAARLTPDQVSLVIRSTRDNATLIALHPDEPRIPASNAKLITSYAALRRLSPQFRWKTRFYLVEANDDPARPSRQGLLVEAGGDPSTRRADLDAIAHRLRAAGVTRLDGPLLYDTSVFEGGPYPEAWGQVEGDMPWYAPVSALILNQNAAVFLVVAQPGGADGGKVQVLPEQPLPGMKILTHFAWIPEGRDVIRVKQLPDTQGLTFAVSGDLLPVARTYTVATAISDPVGQYMLQLRLALQEAGIEGEPAAAPVQGERPPSQLLYEYPSAPLGDVLRLVNKESNNLVAEVMLRALAFAHKPSAVTGEDGLAVVRDVLTEEFPAYADQVRLLDGSGLSRDNQVTAAFLVALLERVLNRFELRAEFVSSLSMGGMDGTLLERNLPERFWGRLRAKTGTLKGVQNLSGYFQFGDDLLVLSFLIRDDARDWSQLQRAQDRALTGILDAYLDEAAPPATARKTLPQLPRGAAAEPPAPHPPQARATARNDTAIPAAPASATKAEAAPAPRQPPLAAAKPELKARSSNATSNP